MYKSIIIYDGDDCPYIQIPVNNIDERHYPELINTMERVLSGYVLATEQSHTWLKRAEEVNTKFRERKDLGDRMMQLLSRSV